LTKASDIRVKKIADKLNFLRNNNLIRIGGGKASNPEKELQRKLKISNTMKNNPNAGGYRKGSGRGKKGWYKGYFCDSQWELAFVIYHLDHNISFERNKNKFKYIYKNVERRYIPDFILNNKYIEIKSFKSELTECKIKAVDKTIEVWYYDEMKFIFDYIEQQYNKCINHIFELYD
jgi:hypothetical protein